MKNELARPIVLFSIGIAIVTILFFIKYYFVKPIIEDYEKTEVSISEQEDLKLLTMAYLNQNKSISLSKFFKNEVKSNQFNVAAEYYYLKNGLEHINEYDKILELSKKIFDNKNIEFSNFVINIDSEKCGKEKYSTLSGNVYNAECDQEDLVYEINDIYYQDNKYVVEFFASLASQKKVGAEKLCGEFEVSLSYNLKLTNLNSETFYDENYSRCCESDCVLKGIKPLNSEILSHIKSHRFIYKLFFKKVDDNFVFFKID